MTKFSNLEEDKSYVVGYTLESIMDNVATFDIFNDIGNDFKYEFDFEDDDILAKFILEKNNLTQYENEELGSKKQELTLEVNKNWVFPAICYIKLAEIKEFVLSLKNYTILIPILQEINNFSDLDIKKLISHLEIKPEMMKEMMKKYNEDNKTYQKYSSENRLTYDCLYLLWLLIALDNQQDLIIFAH